MAGDFSQWAETFIVHPSALIMERLNRLFVSSLNQMPDIIVAIFLLLLFWLAARFIARAIKDVCKRRHKPDLGEVVSGIAKGAMFVMGLLCASAVVFPSVSPANILSALGFGSVAVGFAFKDILQNLMAGILILARRPYARGDRIIVKQYEGTVTAIESRATMLKTLSGERVVIPNSDCYSSAVVVITHFPVRRYEFVIGIGYSNDPGKAIDLFIETLRKVEGVEKDPEPEMLSHALSGSTYDIEARWWVDNKKFNPFHVKSNVILALYQAAVKAGIDMPFPTQTLLLPNLEAELKALGDGGVKAEGGNDGKQQAEGKKKGARAKASAAREKEAAAESEPPKVGAPPAKVSTPKKVQNAGEARQLEVEQTAVSKHGRGELAESAAIEPPSGRGKAKPLAEVKAATNRKRQATRRRNKAAQQRAENGEKADGGTRNTPESGDESVGRKRADGE